MIAYFDTSALIPLIINEPGSARAQTVWNESQAVCASSLIRVEAAAELARAARLGRLAPDELRVALDLLDDYLLDINLIGASELLIEEAARDAVAYSLRGFDAVHFAACMAAMDESLVAISGDKELLAAWSVSGVTTIDVNP